MGIQAFGMGLIVVGCDGEKGFYGEVVGIQAHFFSNGAGVVAAGPYNDRDAFPHLLKEDFNHPQALGKGLCDGFAGGA
jgi:hypothetical protein